MDLDLKSEQRTGVDDNHYHQPKPAFAGFSQPLFKWRQINSNLILPYLKRTKSVATQLPLLYLKGISTGDMLPALESLLDKTCQLTASVASKSAGMLSTNNGVSVTSVGIAMFTFGLMVFIVTLGWTISSAYSSSLVSMTLDSKKSLAFWMVIESQKQVGRNSLSSYERRDYS